MTRPYITLTDDALYDRLRHWKAESSDGYYQSAALKQIEIIENEFACREQEGEI